MSTWQLSIMSDSDSVGSDILFWVLDRFAWKLARVVGNRCCNGIVF